MAPIKALRSLASHHNVVNIASIVLNDEKFPLWSGSSKENQHHYGDGGLIRHTLEVAELSGQANCYLKYPVDAKSLFLACLFHDCGKMWDYEKDANGKWGASIHKRRIHHISRSAIVWSNAVYQFPIYRDIENDVLHAILAHHGQREYGSPVAPNTKLAWLLHLNDSISARIDDAEKFDRIQEEFKHLCRGCNHVLTTESDKEIGRCEGCCSR